MEGLISSTQEYLTRRTGEVGGVGWNEGGRNRKSEAKETGEETEVNNSQVLQMCKI